MSRALIGSVCEDSECELEENEEEGVRFCGDLLLSLFSSESLFSPPSGASPAPRRFPPLARVEGGERRPCFLIGFIFSSSLPFLQTSLFIYLSQRYSLAFQSCSALFFFSLLPILFSFLLCQGLSLSSCLVFVARLRHLPTLFQRLRAIIVPLCESLLSPPGKIGQGGRSSEAAN